MSMTPQLWSISALAVELGMDRRTIAKRIAHVKAAGETAAGKQYRLADVIRAMTDAAAADKAPADYEDAKTRKMTADAVLAEIEVAKARGEVVEIDTMAAAVSEQYATVRARLLALPSKMAPLVVTAKDPTEARDMLERAVVEALEELTLDRDVAGSGYATPGVSRSLDAGPEDASPAAEADGERMGGPVPPPVRRGRSRAGSVDNRAQ